MLHLGDGHRGVLIAALAALGCYAMVLAITFVVHVPLNERLAAAGPPGGIVDPVAVRTSFEGPWVRSNAVRALVNTAAFACLCGALVQHGRLTGG